jgi:hypothetical protein
MHLVVAQLVERGLSNQQAYTSEVTKIILTRERMTLYSEKAQSRE